MDPAKAEQFRKLSEEMEAAMESKMKEIAPAAAAIKADDASHDRNMIEALRRELLALSPAERNSQVGRGRIRQEDVRRAGGCHSELTPAGAPDAGPLVAVNPSFCDGSLPKSAAQLITVHLGAGGLPADHIGGKRQREMLATVDWTLVANLLH